MDGTQLTTGVLVVLLASVMGAIVVLARGRARAWAFVVLAVCAATALASWTRNGAFQDIYVDGDRSDSGPSRKKIHQNRPPLAEHEVADEEHRAPHISSNVRDLADILEVLAGTTCR